MSGFLRHVPLCTLPRDTQHTYSWLSQRTYQMLCMQELTPGGPQKVWVQSQTTFATLTKNDEGEWEVRCVQKPSHASIERTSHSVYIMPQVSAIIPSFISRTTCITNRLGHFLVSGFHERKDPSHQEPVQEFGKACFLFCGDVSRAIWNKMKIPANQASQVKNNGTRLALTSIRKQYN